MTTNDTTNDIILLTKEIIPLLSNIRQCREYETHFLAEYKGMTYLFQGYYPIIGMTGYRTSL